MLFVLPIWVANTTLDNLVIGMDLIMKKSKIMNNEIVFSDKIKTHIDEFYRIRFIMYKEIYNHKTVRIIEYMLKEYLIKSVLLFMIMYTNY